MIAFEEVNRDSREFFRLLYIHEVAGIGHHDSAGVGNAGLDAPACA
jgi:hypothetical protein